MVRKWFAGLAVALAIIVMTTGCYDREELEQQAFVTVMGVDKAPDGQVDCTLRIATPTGSSTAGGGAGSAQPLAASGPVTYRAKSVTEALEIANTSIERTVTLSHLTAIIFGESLAQSGLKSVIQPFVREQQFRRTVFVAVAKGDAKDILKQDKPMLEKSPGRMADSLYVVGNRVGLFPVVQMHQLITAFEDPHQDTVLPVYAINKTVASDPKGEGSLGDAKVSLAPGEVPRQGGNPVGWAGAAVLRGDQLVDFLTGQQVMYLRLLRGNLRSTRIEFPMKLDNQKSSTQQTVGLYLRKEHNPSVTIEEGDPLRIHINVPADADVTTEAEQAQGSILHRQAVVRTRVNQIMGKNMEALLLRLYHKDGVDPIPLSNRIRGHFATYAQYAAYPWQKKLKHASFDVRMQVQIRRFGQRTQPVKES